MQSICMPNKMAPIVTKKALKLGMHVLRKLPSRDVKSLEKVIEVEKLTQNKTKIWI